MFLLDPNIQPPEERMMETVHRLRGLADDLENLALGKFPSTERLGEAPLLDGFVPVMTQRVALTGYSTVHPLLPGKERLITTSDAWMLNPLAGWARTLSRLYRLGTPLNLSIDPSHIQ